MKTTAKLSFVIYSLLFMLSSSAFAQTYKVLSPDGLTYLDVKLADGKLSYSAGYRTVVKAKKKGVAPDTLDVPMLLDSPLGVYTNVADFSKDLTQFAPKVPSSTATTSVKANKARLTAKRTASALSFPRPSAEMAVC